MINPDDLAARRETDFWYRLLTDRSLAACDDLEKILVGCEIIAAVDDPELLPGEGVSAS